MELEREAEREAIGTALESGARGQGQLVVIEGPPGVGKSTLLETARTLAGQHGLEVLSARGSPLEGGMPFGLVIELFAPVLRREGAACFTGVAALAEPLFTPGGIAATAEGAGDGFAFVHGLYWLLVGLAERAPRAVLVENLQWADSPSIRFLAYLADRLEGTAVTVIVALRSGTAPGGPAALRLIRNHPKVRILAPAPLSPDGVTALVRAIVPGADDALCEAVHAATGGNPFLVCELLVALSAEPVESGAAAHRLIDRLAPDAVIRAVETRLADIPEGTALAHAVAVLGGQASLKTTGAVAGLEVDEAVVVAERLRQAGLLAREDPVHFTHPLERLAVYQSIDPAKRGLLHRRALDQLRREGAGLSALLPHALDAPPTGDPELVRTLEQAAGRALCAGEPATAAGYLRRAMSEPPLTEARGPLLVELGRAEALAEDAGALQHLCEGLELVSEPAARAEVLLVAGRELQLFGRDREAAEAFAAGRATLADRDDEALALRLLAGQVSVAAADPVTRPALLEAAFAAAERGDRSDPAHWELCGNLAFAAVVAGRSCAEVIELARRGLARGKLLGELGPGSAALHNACTALGLAGALDEAEEALDQAVENAEGRGLATAAAHVLLRRAVIRYQRGRLLDSIADAERALSAERHGSGPFLSATRAILAVGLLERNELLKAAAGLDRARDEVDERGASLDALLLWARAEVHSAEGAYEDAVAEADQAGRLMTEGLRSRTPALVPWRSTAARAMAALGERDEARRLAIDELAAAEAFGAPTPVGIALVTLGLAEGGDPGLAHFRRAVDVLTGMDARLHEARAKGELGSALRRSGRTKEAQESLRGALDLAERCGSSRLAERLQEELKASGVRPRRRALTGPGALTPSEQRVARLAAEGATNRQIAQRLFVSIKGVEWHLANAYAKLGVKSRRDLAGVLAD